MNNNETGFTLIELLVVIAIMVIIVSSSLINYNKMGRHIELENATQNVALSIREAQVYGINKQSRETGTISFGANYKYGIYFNKTSSISGVSPIKFILYLDDENDADEEFTPISSNCTGLVGDECYSQIVLTKGNHIGDILLKNDATNTWYASDAVDISFIRPNPDAIILDADKNVRSRVKIIINDSTNNITKCVEVGIAGDITVKNSDNCI